MGSKITEKEATMEMTSMSDVPDRKKSFRKSGLRSRFVREISVWALFAKGSIYKVLTILVITSAAEICLYIRVLSRELSENTAVSAFEQMVQYSSSGPVFLAALCLIFIVLLRCETENGGSRVHYTLERLMVTPRHLTLIKLGYNVLCFVLLFGVQAWVGLWMCGVYADRVPSGLVSPQLQFLAFYRVTFLHGILPLADWAKWVGNLLMILALSGELSMSRRHRNISFGLLVISLTWLFSDIESGAAGILAILVFVAAIIGDLMQFLGIWGVDGSIQEEQEP